MSLPEEWQPIEALAECEATPKRILVHDPVAVGAFEEMNGWRDAATLERDLLFREAPDPELYARQHRALVEVLSRFVETVYMADLIEDSPSFESARSNPNQVFTRDSLITIPWIPDGYIPARMRREIRRPETRSMEAAARTLGLEEIVRLPDDLVLEGGDVVPFSRGGCRTLLVGFGRRTELESVEFLWEALAPEHVDEIVGVSLAPYRMNLDGGLLPVAPDVVIADVESILGGVLLDKGGVRKIDPIVMLRELGAEVIETDRQESVYCQSCNCVCLGKRTVVYYDLCDRVSRLLEEHGIRVLLVPGSELVKGRGGPRCMTRPLYA